MVEFNFFKSGIFILVITVTIFLGYNFASGFTVSEFVYKYQDRFSVGQDIDVLVKVKGGPSTEDPAKRAREIRYYQSGVLKFVHFAGAKNVKSDTWYNEFTGTMTTSLAEHIATRNDVISVTILVTNEQIGPKPCSKIGPDADLYVCDLYGKISESNIPEWVKNNVMWWSAGKISDNDFVSGIQYLIENGIIQISS
ncbi:hypothetical protein MnTg01_01237 [archaeon MnTg01]|nr:hypothetical protein MnTg01_01237 [archaeon MnTg01]